MSQNQTDTLEVVIEAVIARRHESWVRQNVQKLNRLLADPETRNGVATILAELAFTQADETAPGRAIECLRGARVLMATRHPLKTRVDDALGLWQEIDRVRPFSDEVRRLLFIDLRRVLRGEVTSLSDTFAFWDAVGDLEDDPLALKGAAEELRNSPTFYRRHREWVDSMATHR